MPYNNFIMFRKKKNIEIMTPMQGVCLNFSSINKKAPSVGKTLFVEKKGVKV
jgi:hypothetical protein